MKLESLKSAALTALLMSCAIIFPAHAKGADRGPIAIGSPALNRCGNVLDPSGSVFVVKDYWHGLTQCLRNLRNIWSARGPKGQISLNGRDVAVRDLVIDQMLYALRQPYVKFYDRNGQQLEISQSNIDAPAVPDLDKVYRVALTNDKGVAYNAMGQSGIAYFGYQFARLAEQEGSGHENTAANFFRNIGRLSMNTILEDVGKGGLASRSKCGANNAEVCVWFHSITRRDRDSRAGGTLNQHLHVLRDFGSLADTLRKDGGRANEETAAKLDAAVIAGLNQLFLSSGHDSREYRPPNLADFLATPGGKKAAQPMFYGFNVGSPQSAGYYLRKPGIDCKYHMHVLDLLDSIFTHLDREGALPDHFASCDTPSATAYARIANAVHLNKNSPQCENEQKALLCQCSFPSGKHSWSPPFLTKLYANCN